MVLLKNLLLLVRGSVLLVNLVTREIFGTLVLCVSLGFLERPSATFPLHLRINVYGWEQEWEGVASCRPCQWS